MDVDYKLLCEQLFGTSDINELKEIAAKVNAVNPRGAGRKPKFTETEIKIMRALAKQGLSKMAIAREFDTTRQTVARHLGKEEERP